MTCSARAANEIVAHARAARPAECCGLLVGTTDEIVDAVRARNLSASPKRFLIDPQDHIDARRGARRRGLDVIGFYHSHPHTPAQPSAADLEQASYRDHLYLIVSLQAEPADIRLFRIDDETFREIPLATG